MSMNSSQEENTHPLAGAKRVRDIEYDDCYSSVEDGPIDNLCEMLSNLKEMKKTFGFMEYFFAGYLFANGVSDTNYIKSTLQDCKLWSQKMKLSFKQKILMMMLKIDKTHLLKSNMISKAKPCEVVNKNKREIKEHQKELEKLKEVNKENPANKPIIFVEESKSQALNDNFKKIQKSEEEHNSDELNLKDIIKIISDAKSEDAEMNNNESKNDVIGDCKICLENIR